MPLPRALIVDDSRTAQHRLKKLLVRYKLEVDLATSAEEALSYLSYRMPSVIFMDHHMEGMDGFEALKIIKANPSTATIPVIMYTSKSDDVYASQAHALGALDTLSKNLMKPSKIEKVLAKLKIHPNNEKTPGARHQLSSRTVSETIESKFSKAGKSTEKESRISAGEFKAQIARLFELHIADLRSQITENTKFVVKRLGGEIKKAANQEQRIDDIPLSVISEEARAETSKMGVVSNALLFLILLGLVAISYQIFQSQSQVDSLATNYSQLANQNTQNTIATDLQANMVVSEAALNKAKLSSDKLLNTISWAVGIDMHFDFGEIPLGEKQILNLQNLAFQLYEAGFRGFVELNIHLGNFCLQSNPQGNLILATPDTPVGNCVFSIEQAPDLSADDYASVPYLQFEQSTAPIQSGAIEFIINVNAFDNPMFSYPDILPATQAAEWNMVARQNQQIVIHMDSEE